MPVPDAFYGEERLAEARAFADVPWWDVFDDPVLKGLVEEALRNGFDVRLAAARVEEARARFGIARSEFFPSISYEGAWQRARADQFLDPSGTSQTRWIANVGLSWQLDLWGRIRRLNESARAQYLATEEGAPGRAPVARGPTWRSRTSTCASWTPSSRSRSARPWPSRGPTISSTGASRGPALALGTARAEAALGEVAAQIPEIERAIVARRT